MNGSPDNFQFWIVSCGTSNAVKGGGNRWWCRGRALGGCDGRLEKRHLPWESILGSAIGGNKQVALIENDGIGKTEELEKI